MCSSLNLEQSILSVSMGKKKKKKKQVLRENENSVVSTDKCTALASQYVLLEYT